MQVSEFLNVRVPSRNFLLMEAALGQADGTVGGGQRAHSNVQQAPRERPVILAMIQIWLQT